MSANTAVALTDDTSEEQARFSSLLQRIAKGEKLEDAMLECRVTRADLDAAVLNPVESQRFQEARLAAVRRGWPILHIEEVCRCIASGSEVTQALIEVRGFEDVSFLELVAADPDVHSRFTKAQEIKSYRDAEKLLQISNDDTKDTLDTVKGPIPNMAAVNRSRLKWEALKFNMAAYNPMWGEKKSGVQVNVQVTNHAEVLEAARSRDRLRDKAPTRITQRVIDAAFTEKPEPVMVVEPETAGPDETRSQAAKLVEAKPADPDALRQAAATEWEEADVGEQPAESFGLDD
jgi:hypothetical protein